MGESSPGEFYKDIKKVIKWVFFAVVALVIIWVSWVSITLVSDHFANKSRENEILSKAIPFTSSHTPWIYNRDDFGTESKLQLWMIGDTDRHAIIEVDGKYSVYSTRPGINGEMTLFHKAGDSCSFASVELTDNSIYRVQCDNKWYTGGPWNKFR
ncbi:hypothetical protein LZ334_02465 [Serratia ureilytica]|uniref:hypothetical protein n=1 Tax=Serratia ureilytica TaxID=300181 RepID=UPI002576A42F|nr:hypothetical protein [Serratia ureilytica]MDM1814957.1 hypothetical protein [Serratia ureilytica]